MAVFQCSRCGGVDNSAHGIMEGRGRRHLPEEYAEGSFCSVCLPTTYKDGTRTRWGVWHNYFTRRYLPPGEFISNPNAPGLIHISDPNKDYRDYLRDEPWTKDTI